MSPLTFGIIPIGPTSESESKPPQGPPDDPERINEALAQLDQGQPFVVRGYVQYIGSGKTGIQAPVRVEQYARNRRKLDLVLGFRAPEEELSHWTGLIRDVVRRYGPHLAMLQIAEEPNSSAAGGDAGTPNVRQAVVQGVIAAKDEARRQGHDIQVGFNATPNFNPQDDFWATLGTLGQQDFHDALDYVALDFFPDVFRPLPPDGSPMDLREAVTALIKHFRNVNMAQAGIPLNVPLHIGENGWPTSATRSYERQAIVLETIVRILAAHRAELNITHYEYFALRDGDSSNPNFWYQWGLLRDDYTPKPAFERYRKLIAELGAKS
jgi:hypothetical protein